MFIKRGSKAEAQLRQMKELVSLPGVDASRLERDIRLMESGVYGEGQIAFELENSGLPIFVLQDLRLEHEGLSGQIDFLVITPHVNLVVECKNLFGNIAINGHGEWIREFDYGTGLKREGIYSPVTQNERHLRLLKEVRQADQGFIFRVANSLWFDDYNHSVIVLANHKTIFKASGEYRDLVVRADKLVGHIKKLDAEHKDNGRRSAKEMEDVARYWLSKHVEKHADLGAQYKAERCDGAGVIPACPVCGKEMVLRTARKGRYAGSAFYGCSNYPDCRGIVNL